MPQPPPEVQIADVSETEESPIITPPAIPQLDEEIKSIIPAISQPDTTSVPSEDNTKEVNPTMVTSL